MSPRKPTLEEIHDLARKGQKLFAVNKDPLTAHAAELLFRARSARLDEPQQNAAIVLKNQVAAYEALYLEPL